MDSDFRAVEAVHSLNRMEVSRLIIASDYEQV